jgi:intein-encoded DNA endonuclease-like protein
MELFKTKERFIELRAKGLSFDKISKDLKVSKQTLIDWSKDLEEEIRNLKALELEALLEKYYLLKENRIQTFGDLLSKLKTELLKRDFTDLSTDKLLDLILKYESQIREEIVDPVFKTSQEIEEDKIDRQTIETLLKVE